MQDKNKTKVKTAAKINPAIKETVLNVRKIQQELFDEYPLVAGEILESIKIQLMEYIVADFIVNEKSEFLEIIRSFKEDTIKLYESKEGRDMIKTASSHLDDLGDEEQRDKIVENSINMCKTATVYALDKFSGLANQNITKTKKATAKKKRSSKKKAGAKKGFTDAEGNFIET